MLWPTNLIGFLKEALEQRVLQMVVPDRRLWKWSVDQIAVLRVLSLQEHFGTELVVRLKAVNLGTDKLQRINIIGKLRLVIVPEYQLAGISGELGVELVRYLF